MERRIKNKIETFISEFKVNLRTEIDKTNLIESQKSKLLQFLYNYPKLEISKTDFLKRKRVKNIVPILERCVAKRANLEQCTRRRKDNLTLCGTHSKGTPHGIVEISENLPKQTKIQVWAEDIKGIIYYIDNDHNVYHPQDIYQNIKNPKKIAKWVRNENGQIFIPQFAS